MELPEIGQWIRTIEFESDGYSGIRTSETVGKVHFAETKNDGWLIIALEGKLRLVRLDPESPIDWWHPVSDEEMDKYRLLGTLQQLFLRNAKRLGLADELAVKRAAELLHTASYGVLK